MDLIEALLVEIDQGKKSFKPISTKKEDMEDFQSIAKALIYAYEKNLISKIFPHQESTTGNRWYDLVLVENGLSFEGIEYKNNLSAKSKIISSSTDDIFILKPSFMGVSIDLRAAYRWYTNK